MRGPPRRTWGPPHLRQRRPPAPPPLPEKERTWPFALCPHPADPARFNVRGPDGYVVFDKGFEEPKAAAERDRLNAAADRSGEFATVSEPDGHGS